GLAAHGKLIARLVVLDLRLGIGLDRQLVGLRRECPDCPPHGDGSRQDPNQEVPAAPGGVGTFCTHSMTLPSVAELIHTNGRSDSTRKLAARTPADNGTPSFGIIGKLGPAS